MTRQRMRYRSRATIDPDGVATVTSRRVTYRGYAINESPGACWIAVPKDGSYQFASAAEAMAWVDARIDTASPIAKAIDTGRALRH